MNNMIYIDCLALIHSCEKLKISLLSAQEMFQTTAGITLHCFNLTTYIILKPIKIKLTLPLSVSEV